MSGDRDTSLFCSLCQPSQPLHGLTESALLVSGETRQRKLCRFLKNTLLCVHREGWVESPCFILTKTQPVSGKLPFVIVRKLCRVYVNIIVPIYLLDNLPLYFIHGFLEEKGKAMSPVNHQLPRSLRHPGEESTVNGHLEVFVGEDHHDDAHHASRDDKANQQRGEQGVGLDLLCKGRES